MSGRLATIRGAVPHPSERPVGCPFHPRCDHAVAGVCDTISPPEVEVGPGRTVRCVMYVPDLVPEDAAGLDGERSWSVDEDVRTAPDPSSAPIGAEALLEVSGLKVHFPLKKGLFGRTVAQVRAVDGVDLTIGAGETVGLVGESGCGKTTLGRTIARILKPTQGHLNYRARDGRVVDLSTLSRRELKPFQREIRVVFQDPFSSLNPRMTLLQIIGEPLKANRIATGSELEDRVAEMLTRVGLSSRYLRRYPHQFSGGERQRVNIARALIVDPRLVIADEPVSALDVSLRGQILNLLRELQAELGLTYLFISHDLSVVESICDRAAVMYLGRIVELAEITQLYQSPQHPYTEALLSAVPQPDPDLRARNRRILLADDLPDPASPPPGCNFHTRCRYALAGTCDVMGTDPQLRAVEPGQVAACFRSDDLILAGVER